MSNILIIDGHQNFDFAKGQLNKTLFKKTILKTILPLFFGGYVLLGFFVENARYFIYESFLYIIPGSVSFVINLYLAKKNK